MNRVRSAWRRMLPTETRVAGVTFLCCLALLTWALWPAGESGENADEDVVDAEFSEVDDEQKN